MNLHELPTNTIKLCCIAIGCLVILIMCGCSVPPNATTSASLQPKAITPFVFVTQTLPPDYAAQNISSLEKAIRTFNIDFSCTPPCWNHFVPGKTSMGEVFRWHENTFSSRLQSTKGNPSAPNNVTGVGQGGIATTAFSDDTQPEPLLRAFSLGITLPPEASPAKISSPTVEAWLPQNILKQRGNPLRIIQAEPSPEAYFLLIEFKNWSVQYRGSKIQMTGSSAKRACPAQKLPSITVWVYSERDAEALSLIQSLIQYEHASGYINPNILPDKSKLNIITDTAKITQITDTITQTGCIPFG